MTRPFYDDIHQGPDLLRDWWKSKELEEFKNRTLPTLSTAPPASYPWCVNPPTQPTLPDLPPGSYPYWIIPPAPPMLPSPAPGNRKPVNSAPISLNPTTGAARSAGGLLGMLYAIMQEGEAKPDGDPDTNPQGASQALPERRLGRRTKRQSSDPDQSS